jgi:hypothetical protein
LIIWWSVENSAFLVDERDSDLKPALCEAMDSASFPNFFWQTAALKRGNHRQIDKLDISFRFPQQKDAAFRLDRNVVTVRNSNLAAIRQVQDKGMRLSRITAE